MAKYIESKIDGETYCVSNGQFARHIKAHSHTRQSYYECYMLGYTPLCPICNAKPRKYQKADQYTDACSKECAAKLAWEHIDREAISQKRRQIWQDLSELEKQAISNRRKKTNQTRYGGNTPSSSQHVRDRMRGTCQAKYGSNSPLQSESVKNKIKQSLVDNYGVEHPMHSEKIKQKVSYSLKNNAYQELPNKEKLEELYDGNIENVMSYYAVNKSTAYRLLRENQISLIKTPGSVFEREVAEFVETLGVHDIIKNDRTVLIGKELDIYIPELDIAIECNGSYWHSELQGKDRHYHKTKSDVCREQGINLMHIWQHEWLNNHYLVKSRLTSKLGKAKRIFARKCQVKTVSFKVCEEFLNTSHIQGNCMSSIRYGLYYQDELVAVMTFGKSRFDKNIEWELLRYSCSPYTNIVGGASKLFKYFTRTHKPKSILSYSDRMRNSGALYEKLGFEWHHATTPAYYYTQDYLLFENRVAYQKHKLEEKLEIFDADKTEWENMVSNGYDRIWDCGTDVFHWHAGPDQYPQDSAQDLFEW